MRWMDDAYGGVIALVAKKEISEQAFEKKNEVLETMNHWKDSLMKVYNENGLDTKIQNLSIFVGMPMKIAVFGTIETKQHFKGFDLNGDWIGKCKSQRCLPQCPFCRKKEAHEHLGVPDISSGRSLRQRCAPRRAS